MLDLIYYEGLVFGLVAAFFLGILYLLLLVFLYKIRAKKIREQQERALEKWRRGHENDIGYIIDIDPGE